MSGSRWTSIIAVLAGVGAAAAAVSGLIPGEAGCVVAAIAAGLAAFNERIQGGTSKKG